MKWAKSDLLEIPLALLDSGVIWFEHLTGHKTKVENKYEEKDDTDH